VSRKTLPSAEPSWYSIREFSAMTAVEYMTGDRFDDLRARGEHLASADDLAAFLTSRRPGWERIDREGGFDLVRGDSHRIEIRQVRDR
jgi:hypothetical protein